MQLERVLESLEYSICPTFFANYQIDKFFLSCRYRTFVHSCGIERRPLIGLTAVRCAELSSAVHILIQRRFLSVLMPAVLATKIPIF